MKSRVSIGQLDGDNQVRETVERPEAQKRSMQCAVPVKPPLDESDHNNIEIASNRRGGVVFGGVEQ